MTREMILQLIRETAGPLGLSPERVMDKSKKDGLTIPRPRLEVDFLREDYDRGAARLLGTRREGRHMEIKKQLYAVKLQAAALVLATEESWLENFCHDLVAAMPRGVNDERGNWVKISAVQGAWGGFEKTRVAMMEIDPLPKRERLIHFNFEGRVTTEEAADLLHSPNINVKFRRG